MPMMASTPAMRATISSGSPNMTSTADNVTSPAAGTPAVPMDRSVPIRTMTNKSDADSCKLVIFAANTMEIPMRNAPPSELKMAPSGRAKFAVFSEIPAFLADLMAIGKDARLLDVKNAVVQASFVLRKNGSTALPESLRKPV